MADGLAIENYEIVNNLLIVCFSDKSESMVSLKTIKTKMPLCFL